MTKRFYTSGKCTLAFLLVLLTTGPLEAQVYISGPECITPGIPYQYTVHFNEGDSSSVKVCITGGTLVGGDRCTPEGAFPASVFVMWNDTSDKRVELQSFLGSSALIVQTMEPLLGGVLIDSTKIQVYDSTITNYSFPCNAATGGSCSPAYEYQWQKSENGLSWTNINDATGKDLLFSEHPLNDTYFRRASRETKSTTIAYSDIGVLHVFH